MSKIWRMEREGERGKEMEILFVVSTVGRSDFFDDGGMGGRQMGYVRGERRYKGSEDRGGTSDHGGYDSDD